MYTNYKLNWLNVIINSEFQSYLNTTTIKEISLLSKVVREKLKPLVFIKLKISKSNLDYRKSSIIMEHYGHHSFHKNAFSALEGVNDHGINSVLNDFATAMKSIKKFVKNLQFCDFGGLELIYFQQLIYLTI
jgi:hypothetical protein